MFSQKKSLSVRVLNLRCVRESSWIIYEGASIWSFELNSFQIMLYFSCPHTLQVHLPWTCRIITCWAYSLVLPCLRLLMINILSRNFLNLCFSEWGLFWNVESSVHALDCNRVFPHVTLQTAICRQKNQLLAMSLKNLSVAVFLVFIPLLSKFELLIPKCRWLLLLERA